MSRIVLIIVITLLTILSDVLSSDKLVKRADDLVPTHGGQNGHTPANIPYTTNGGSPQDRNRPTRTTNRPPELPRDHPIRPQPLPPVQYEEDKPSMWQRLTGKKRKAALSHDHEASTSGTKDESGNESSPPPSPKRAREKSEIDKWIDDIHDQRRRRRYSQSWRQNQAEDDLVAKGLVTAVAAAGYGAVKTYQAGKRMISDVKDTCVGACRRIRQRIRSGGMVLNERPRQSIQRYRPANTPRNVVYDNQLRAQERLAEIKRNQNQGVHGTRGNLQQPSTAQHHRHDVRDADSDVKKTEKGRKHITGTKSLDKKSPTESMSLNLTGQNDNRGTTTGTQRSRSAPPDYRRYRNKSLTRSKSLPRMS
ncbi:uncharacterized protein FA14DRAFT_72340 [Meira miltonrushii]|uniref:DUF3824 domain-containing protein n=1 Tax=Meira miltonrushii TaxID=1280837 RepID=A0A316VA28_9BASI|nr:uncharacterized protein FA14DRAFT_72340 [Meira miltonrushii]PWN34427.1 hypothetical protein FA14DRAFT_72340 [Meira miltonrushii]